MKRIIAAAMAGLALGAATPAAAQSWSVVDELERHQGVVRVRWRLWRSDETPARLREEVVAAVTAPTCVGLIIRPRVEVDYADSIGNFIMHMRPEDRTLVLARINYAAGQAYQGQTPMSLIQQPIGPDGPDGPCAPYQTLQPVRPDPTMMSQTRATPGSPR